MSLKFAKKIDRFHRRNPTESDKASLAYSHLSDLIALAVYELDRADDLELKQIDEVLMVVAVAVSLGLEPGVKNLLTRHVSVFLELNSMQALYHTIIVAADTTRTVCSIDLANKLISDFLPSLSSQALTSEALSHVGIQTELPTWVKFEQLD